MNSFKNFTIILSTLALAFFINLNSIMAKEAISNKDIEHIRETLQSLEGQLKAKPSRSGADNALSVLESLKTNYGVKNLYSIGSLDTYEMLESEFQGIVQRDIEETLQDVEQKLDSKPLYYATVIDALDVLEELQQKYGEKPIFAKLKERIQTLKDKARRLLPSAQK